MVPPSSAYGRFSPCPTSARAYTTSIEGVLPADTAWSVSTGALIGWLTILFLTSARRYLLADARASVSSENGRSGSGVLTEAAATSVAPLVALFFAWSAWPSENLSGVHLASLAVTMALVYLVAALAEEWRRGTHTRRHTNEMEWDGDRLASHCVYEARLLVGL